jgi:phosphate transport system substrate-binding protein
MSHGAYSLGGFVFTVTNWNVLWLIQGKLGENGTLCTPRRERIQCKKGKGGMKLCVRMLIILSIASILVASTRQFSDAQESAKEVIKVRGSDSMAAMIDSHAGDFMKSHPNLSIIVSGGQDIAFDALSDKAADIVMASRQISPQEKDALTKKGIDIQGKVVGWGGIVIIVNPQNPINELTADQVRKVFSGEYKNWKEAGGPDQKIDLFTVGEQRGGTLDFVRNDFLKGPFAPNAVSKMYFRSILSDVSKDETATGFVRVRNILQLTAQGMEKTVKVLAIKKDEQSPAVLPSRETCNNGTYPITRPYYLYLDQKSVGKSAKDFFEFCVSKNPRSN